MNNLDNNHTDRRSKWRFVIQRELRYKVVDADQEVAQGNGHTANISSAGVAFKADQPLTAGLFVELSISWPVLLQGDCPVRLIVFGRVLRMAGGLVACTVEKYEFRTQPRYGLDRSEPSRNDTRLLRWVESVRRDGDRPAAREAVRAAAGA